jgi:hypothetical protein
VRPKANAGRECARWTPCEVKHQTGWNTPSASKTLCCLTLPGAAFAVGKGLSTGIDEAALSQVPNPGGLRSSFSPTRGISLDAYAADSEAVGQNCSTHATQQTSQGPASFEVVESAETLLRAAHLQGAYGSESATYGPSTFGGAVPPRCPCICGPTVFAISAKRDAHTSRSRCLLCARET